MLPMRYASPTVRGRFKGTSSKRSVPATQILHVGLVGNATRCTPNANETSRRTPPNSKVCGTGNRNRQPATGNRQPATGNRQPGSQQRQPTGWLVLCRAPMPLASPPFGRVSHTAQPPFCNLQQAFLVNVGFERRTKITRSNGK